MSAFVSLFNPRSAFNPSVRCYCAINEATQTHRHTHTHLDWATWWGKILPMGMQFSIVTFLFHLLFLNFSFVCPLSLIFCIFCVLLFIFNLPVQFRGTGVNPGHHTKRWWMISARENMQKKSPPVIQFELKTLLLVLHSEPSFHFFS